MDVGILVSSTVLAICDLPGVFWFQNSESLLSLSADHALIRGFNRNVYYTLSNQTVL